MAEIAYTEDALIVHVTGWDKVWALKSQLTIPLAHVVGAEAVNDEGHWAWRGVRLPGTHIPGVITAGTFQTDGGRVFWDVHDASRAVVIHLRDDRYTDLVIQVDDPTTVIDAINRHVPR